MDQERVLGYLDMHGGGIRSPRYTLIATDRRLVIAQRTHEVEQAFGGGGGGLGRLFGGGKPRHPVGEHYLAMTPEAMVAETPGNVAIGPGDVALAETIYHEEYDPDSEPIRWVLIHLRTRDKDWQLFTNDEAPRLDAVRALIAPALGPMLRG